MDALLRRPAGRGLSGAAGLLAGGARRRDVKGVLRSLVEFVLPSLCVVCSRGASAFCRGCRDGVAPVDSVALGGLNVHAVGAYDGALRTAVLALKHGRRDVGVALADFVAERWTPPAGAILVPVPTAAARRDARGFDQAVLLARELGRQSGLPVLAVLCRTGGVAQQGRARSERLLATGRFDVAPGARAVPVGARAIVVDDVVTTGATLRDAAATLARAGVVVASGIAIARAYPAAPASSVPTAGL